MNLVLLWLVFVVIASVYMVKTGCMENVENYRRKQRAWLDKPEKRIEDKWKRH